MIGLNHQPSQYHARIKAKPQLIQTDLQYFASVSPNRLFVVQHSSRQEDMGAHLRLYDCNYGVL